MKNVRLLVALAALALCTAAMACDDDDDGPPPERASVVQALLDGAAAQHA
jgi:hypothetical protein